MCNLKWSTNTCKIQLKLRIFVHTACIFMLLIWKTWYVTMKNEATCHLFYVYSMRVAMGCILKKATKQVKYVSITHHKSMRNEKSPGKYTSKQLCF